MGLLGLGGNGGGGLGDLGSYMGPSPVVTLTRTITDPGNTPATRADCVPFMCGVDQSNVGVRQWCSYWGQVGNLACIDGDCLPFVTQIPNCQIPVPTPITPKAQPAIVPTAVATTPAPQPPLTPPDLNQRLPSIVNPGPVEVGPPPCESVSVWIARNQGLVLVGLGMLALAFWGKGGER